MQNIEEILKDYYKKQKRIEYLKGRYEVLGNNIREIEQCISETKYTLEVELPAQRYDLERVSTSKEPSSPQEKALLDAERRMEQKLQMLKSDRYESLMERCDIERDCEKINDLLLVMEDEEILICEMRYKYNRTFSYIGYKVDADPSTIHRRMTNIHKKMINELGLTA